MTAALQTPWLQVGQWWDYQLSRLAEQGKGTRATGPRPLGLVSISEQPRNPQLLPALNIGAEEGRRQKMARRVREAINLQQSLAFMERDSSPSFLAFVTLTYRDADDWRPEHITRFMDHFRKWFRRRFRRQPRYTWVLEMQQRGAPHYHLCVWLPRGKRMPKPDRQGWWPHGSTQVKAWVGDASRYMAKYMSKADCIAYPRGARAYGMGGFCRDDGTRYELYHRCLPAWLAKITEYGERWTRTVEGLASSLREAVVRSPFEFSGFLPWGGVRLLRVAPGARWVRGAPACPF